MERLVNFLYKASYILATKKDRAFGVISVFEEKGRRLYLVVKANNNKWVLPKGHALVGEDQRKAALRELGEETGIKDCQLEENFKVDQYYTFRLGKMSINKTVTYFLGIAKSRKVKVDNKELIDFEWLPFKEAVKRLSHDNSKRLIVKAEEFLNGQ